ncbi:hypothetical protein IL306_005147 [Fusarium sp. DS 682]|nr:hypothetical protein IL306_005147 [Fusarium sp. DS 682]
MSYLELDLPEDDDADEATSAVPPPPSDNVSALPEDQPQESEQQQDAVNETEEYDNLDNLPSLDEGIEANAEGYLTATEIQPSSVPSGQNYQDHTSRTSVFSSSPPRKRRRSQLMFGTETVTSSVPFTGFLTGLSTELKMPGTAPGNNISQFSPLTEQTFQTPSYQVGTDLTWCPQSELRQYGKVLRKRLQLLDNLNPGSHKLVRLLGMPPLVQHRWRCYTGHLCFDLDVPPSPQRDVPIPTINDPYFIKVILPHRMDISERQKKKDVFFYHLKCFEVMIDRQHLATTPLFPQLPHEEWDGNYKNIEDIGFIARQWLKFKGKVDPEGMRRSVENIKERRRHGQDTPMSEDWDIELKTLQNGNQEFCTLSELLESGDAFDREEEQFSKPLEY